MVHVNVISAFSGLHYSPLSTVYIAKAKVETENRFWKTKDPVLDKEIRFLQCLELRQELQDT